MTLRKFALLATAAVTLAAATACGETQGDRGLSGAGIGAGTGAVIGAACCFLVGAIPGALIGGAVGAGTGVATTPNQVDLGTPPWRRASN